MNVKLIESKGSIATFLSNLFPRLHADTYREHVEKREGKKKNF